MEKGLGFLAFIFIAGFIIFLLAQAGLGKINFGKDVSIFSFLPVAGVPPARPFETPPAPMSSLVSPQSAGGGYEYQGTAPTPPAGFTAAQLSPYYGKVRLNWVRPAYGSSGVAEFSLSSALQSGESLAITGWRLASNKSAYAAVIPQAVFDYKPLGALIDGPITLTSGSRVSVIGGVSPLGKNFQLNKCTGYLNDLYAFNPSLPSNCPTPYDRSEITTFPGNCQSFILSLYGCRTIKPDDINRAAGYQDAACRAFLDRFNFNACYERHSQNADFYSGEWRVWLGNIFIPFDREHDRILLFDDRGLLVDQYVY